MGEAKNRKEEIKNLKANGKKINAKDYILENPYLNMWNMPKNKCGVIVSNTPYGFHFDIPIKNLEVSLDTLTADLFKKIVAWGAEDVEKHYTNKVIYKLYAYRVNGIYTRFEVLTSHELLTDYMEAWIPALKSEHDSIKKEAELGRNLSDNELSDLLKAADDEVKANLSTLSMKFAA